MAPAALTLRMDCSCQTVLSQRRCSQSSESEQVAAEALCWRMLWARPGIYTWLLAATRRPVAAIAAYDAEAVLKLVLTFGRHGVASSHLRALASPKRVSSCQLADR